MESSLRAVDLNCQLSVDKMPATSLDLGLLFVIVHGRETVALVRIDVVYRQLTVKVYAR